MHFAKKRNEKLQIELEQIRVNKFTKKLGGITSVDNFPPVEQISNPAELRDSYVSIKNKFAALIHDKQQVEESLRYI